MARVGWGGLLVVAAPRLIRAIGLPSDTRTIVVVRVLGLRHLVQAAVVRQKASSVRVGAWIDLIHGSSMVVFALLDAPKRRAALLDAVVAFGFAAGGLATGTETGRQLDESANRHET